MSRHYPTRPLACLVLLSGLTAGSVQADVVADWNSVALDAVIAARRLNRPRPAALRWFTSRCLKPNMPNLPDRIACRQYRHATAAADQCQVIPLAGMGRVRSFAIEGPMPK
jgi:hypothetical protein